MRVTGSQSRIARKRAASNNNAVERERAMIGESNPSVVVCNDSSDMR